MKEFFEKYEYLRSYSEFISEKIELKYRYFIKDDEVSGDGHWDTPHWMFDVDLATKYAMLVYLPDSPISHVKELDERKARAVEMVGIPQEFLPLTGNLMLGDMATRIFREVNDFDYELLISAKEAVEILMEVVRKPVDTRLQDDKERNAVKAKRECYDDAKYMMGEIKKLFAQLNDESVDVAEHANRSVFRGGLQEKLAEKTKKS
jgi:hypothetical protein